MDAGATPHPISETNKQNQHHFIFISNAYVNKTSWAFIIDYSQNQDSEYDNARLSENIVRVLLDQVVERVYQEHDIDYEFTDEDLSGITKFLNLQLMLGEEINLINFE